MTTAARLPTRTVLAYGGPGLPLAAMALTFYVYFPKYYADVLAIDLTLLGIIILLSRVWDALIDPAVGRLSDRTRTRWGRRAPWMAAGAAPLALAFVALAAPPGVDIATAPAGLALLTFAFFLFWTIVSVPYEALGAEISLDYDERTRLIGVRELIVLVGTLVAAVLPAVLDATLGTPTTAGETRQRFLIISATYGALALGLVAFCATTIEERRWRRDQLPAPERLVGEIREVLRNRPFRILLGAYTIGAIGAVLPATLIFFYVEYVLGSARGELFLILYLGLGAAFFPVWLWLARRVEKRSAYLAAMAINTGAFIGVAFLGAGDAWMYAVLISISAIGLGGTLALPPSMQADVIDYDEWRRGQRREGEYTGLWSIAKKLAQALGAGVAFPILEIAGYVPQAAQSPTTLTTLRWLYAGVPCLCNAAAMAIIWRYPIDRRTHARLRRDIDAGAFGSVGEPLPDPV